MSTNKGSRGGARRGAGRKKGGINSNSLTGLIAKECSKMISELAKNDQFKKKLLFESDQPGFKEEYFYVLKSFDGLYKVGYTSSLKSRMKAYQSNGGALTVEMLFKSVHAFKIESAVISKYCSGSEWTSLSERDIVSIRNLCHKIELGGSPFAAACGEFHLLNQM